MVNVVALPWLLPLPERLALFVALRPLRVSVSPIVAYAL